MKELMKKRKRFIIVCTVIWLIGILLTFMTGSQYNERIAAIVSEDAFAQNASVNCKEDWVGANIWLKQAIHGTKDIKYRYVVKTDCPSWDYETRYMTTKPIEWIDETSAVEVLIYDTTVWYGGTAYANGQYFLIPILDNLASEPVNIDEWKEQLVKQAYQSYVSAVKADKTGVVICNWFIFVWPCVCMFRLIWMNKKKPELCGTDGPANLSDK